MLRFRLIGCPRPSGWSHPDVEFLTDLPLERADGLLQWGAVHPEFLTYRGVRGWYISEPITESCFGTKPFRQALQSIRSGEYLHHSNTDPRYQVPAETHYGPRLPIRCKDRPITIAATVNNYGNRRWRLLRAHRLRNSFLMDSRVALYGNEPTWRRFQTWPWMPSRLPANFRGETGAGNCHHPDFWNFLTQIRIYVCLENSITPYWFTEKMINAARTGCVPIYHAHSTVRERFLQGAHWIDPADHDFNADRTIRAALAADHDRIREQNYTWLQSRQLDPTEGYAIWTRIANILADRWRTERGGALVHRSWTEGHLQK